MVDKSLVGQTEGPDGNIRFGLLETIREFGLECLAAADEERALRQCHADYYLSLAEESGSSFTATVQESSLARLQVEHPNFRQALAYYSANGASAKLLRMAGALAWFWHTHAHITEGMRWMEEALKYDDRSDPAARAKALLALALMVRFRGESERALTLAEESLELYRTVGDGARILEASSGVAFIAYGLGNIERVEALGGEIVRTQRPTGNDSGVAIGLTLLAFAESMKSEHERALPYLDEALRLQRASGDSYWAAHSLSTLGYQYLMLGEQTRAAEVLHESLEINWRMSNKAQTAWCLYFLAILASARGRYEAAARLIGAEVSLRTAVGTFIPPQERHQHDKVEADLRVRLGADRFAAAYAAGQALPHQEAVAEGLAIATERAPTVVVQSSPTNPFELTERELEVLALVVEGLSDREIGDRLYVSHRTAQKHVSNIFIKLHVSTRTAAATAALRAGLVTTGASPNH
jgi:non-specific serine/threonine protein kinase